MTINVSIPKISDFIVQLSSSLGPKLNTTFTVVSTTTNFSNISKHSRRPRFVMLASYRFMNYITKLIVSHHHWDGYPPSQGWSPTIQNLPEGSALQT